MPMIHIATLLPIFVIFEFFTSATASELSEELWLMPGESVDLSCRAERVAAVFAKLNTRWERSGKIVASSSHARLLPDAGLRLLDLRLTDNGIYICRGRVEEVVVDVNTVRVHVGSPMEEALMMKNGLWTGLGVPILWGIAFQASILVCLVFMVVMITMRIVYKIKVKKYTG